MIHMIKTPESGCFQGFFLEFIMLCLDLVPPDAVFIEIEGVYPGVSCHLA